VASSEVEEVVPQDILMRSNDYADVLAEYWPRISRGDANAMAVSFEALNDCWNFRDEISRASDINEFDEMMRKQSVTMQDYGRALFYKCKNIVDRFGEFPGWEKLRERAAIAGHRASRLFIVSDFYRFRHERPRESWPFSPAGFLIEALADKDPRVFVLIGTGSAPWGVRMDSSPVTSAAWLLVFCHYWEKDCSGRESMETQCMHQTERCLADENFLDEIRDEAGGDEQFDRAIELSRELIQLVEQRDYEAMGLDLVW